MKNRGGKGSLWRIAGFKRALKEKREKTVKKKNKQLFCIVDGVKPKS